MRFIYPSFLWALLLVAVPVLIHILNLRRHKTVYFSNVEFLKRVQRETKKRTKLKQLIILVCRVLAVMMLVIAFAKPYKPVGYSVKQSVNHVACIYVDNSYSMNADGTEGKAIESAKNKAREIVSASRPDTKFALLTNEMSEKHHRFYNQQEMLQLISEIETGYTQLPLTRAIQRFRSMMENFLQQTDKTVYLISDFQHCTTDLSNLVPDSVVHYNLVPVKVNAVSNLAIDSCWFETPAHYLTQQEVLEVRVRNYADQEYRQLPLKFLVNDTVKALATVDIGAGETKVVPLTFTNQRPGFQDARVEITDYPIVYDNTMYLSYQVKQKVKALNIGSDIRPVLRSNFVEALFNNDDFVELDNITSSKVQINQFGNYSTIFLNELQTISTGLVSELKNYIENGGTLVFVPSSQSDIGSYNYFLSSFKSNTIIGADTSSVPVSKVLFEHPLYNNVFKEKNQKVDLPKLGQRFRFTQQSDNIETWLMTLADETKALSVSSLGKGRLFVFAFPFSSEKNKFPEHMLFVPTLFNIVLTSSSFQEPYHVLDANNAVAVGVESNIMIQNPKLINLSSGEEIIPLIRKSEGNKVNIFVESEIDAGIYKLMFDGVMADHVAFNHNLSESEMACYTIEDVQYAFGKAQITTVNALTGQSDNLSVAINEIDNGKSYWKLFILLGLIFIIGEAMVIRFWP